MNIMNIIKAVDADSLAVLIRQVVGACFEVSNVLGGGFLEKVYERALVEELRIQGLQATAQVPIVVPYKGIVAGEYYCDVLVEGVLIVELKCCERLTDEHIAQCINYVQATGIPLMLLVNFQNPRLEWRRIYRKGATEVHEDAAIYNA